MLAAGKQTEHRKHNEFNWVDRCDEITRRMNQKRHTTIKACPIDAIRPGTPSYDECLRRIRQYAQKKYGGRVVDAVQEGQVGSALLAAGDLVRIVKRKTGMSMGKLTWDKIGKSAADNFSTTVYRIRAVIPSRGWTQTTYQLEELNGDQRLGKYDRNQLQPIDDQTPGVVETDDDDDDDDDDDEDDDDDDQDADGAAAAQVAAQNADPVLPRPRVEVNTFRYEEGDVLMFAEGWDHEPAIPGGRRGREGIVADCSTAQIGGQNALAHTIRFMLDAG